MKHLLSLLLLALSLSASAATFEPMPVVCFLEVTGDGSDITSQLRKAASSLSLDDVLEVSLDEGTFYIAGTVNIGCNLVIRGKGVDESTLVFKYDSIDRATSGYYPQDDSYLTIKGQMDNPISVKMSDLSMRLIDHGIGNIWWTEAEPRYLVKIYCGNGIDFKRVNSYCDNAFCNNIDMRACSNIAVDSCVLVNYNNCHAGANLSIRQNTENVTISNCTFDKYGNDEALTLFGVGYDPYHSTDTVTSHCVKKNIHITDNTFNYGKGFNTTTGGVDIPCDIYFSFHAYNDVDLSGKIISAATMTIDDFELSNNTFNIYSNVLRTGSIAFDEKTSHSNVIVHHNAINYMASSSATASFRIDFSFNDKMTDSEPIEYCNNTMTNYSEVVASWGTPNHAHMSANYLTEVNYHDNQVVNHVTSSSNTSDGRYGVILFQVYNGSPTFKINNNEIEGLYMMGQLSLDNGIDNVSIIASDNVFKGDTRIFCRNLKRAGLTFSNNIFYSTNSTFFLEDFAESGAVIFSGNTVYNERSDGRIFTHWGDSTAAENMHFAQLFIVNNTFYKTTEEVLVSHIKSMGNVVILNNTYQ